MMNFGSGAGIAMPGVVGRVCVGLAVATAVAGAARFARQLDTSGAVAAVLCGTAAAAGGFDAAFVLLGYFVAIAAVSRLGRATKERRSSGTISKGGARDAAQVLANGGLFAAALAASAFTPGEHLSQLLRIGGFGALAASSADSWATEIGMLLGGTPRSIITGTPLPRGESGGVTWAGTLASLVGALVVAGLTILVGNGRGVALASLVGGMIGATFDSLLGATVQERRYCDACDMRTEQPVHACGRATRRSGGVAYVQNDVVNAAATIAGFVAGALARGATGG